jgi:hypothetical protein
MAFLDIQRVDGTTIFYGSFPSVKTAKLVAKMLIRTGKAIRFSIR